MAEDDIYKNKRNYERFVANLDKLIEKPKDKKTKYYCKNPSNIRYFRELINYFEGQDLSYIKRLRNLSILKAITYFTDKDLKDIDRTEMNRIVAELHKVYKSPESKDFIKKIKRFWKLLFPDPADEDRLPYVVRHLNSKIDKSKEVLKNNIPNYEEYEKIVNFFNNDLVMQSVITLTVESLARPQEICYRTIADVHLFDNYATIDVSSHGKEGVKFLWCIDSYPYLANWLKVHPFANNKDSYLFVNSKSTQLTPYNINKKLRKACRVLGIEKRITMYSLKRFGVTIRRLRGDSDLTIQHVAGWSSTKQLKVYDKSLPKETFKVELIKRGIVKPDKNYKFLQPKTKRCIFCSKEHGFTVEICDNCKRPLDREKLREQEHKKELLALDKFMQIPEIQKLFKVVYKLQKEIKELKS